MKGLFVGAVFLSCSFSFGAISIESFKNPPRDVYPETWFHFIGGNVTKEGITRDLEAIATSGISGVQNFHGQVGKASMWPGVTNQIPCLCNQWEDVIEHMANECKRLGLKFKMQNCPGWSMSGGPWVKPENSMRMLTYSRLDFTSDGGAVNGCFAEGGLPVPENWCDAKDRSYQDICVLAFPSAVEDDIVPLTPVSVSDAELGKAMSVPPAKSSVDLFQRAGVGLPPFSKRISEVSFAHPVTIRTLELPAYAVMNRGYACEPDLRVRLEAFVNGAWLTTLDTKIVQSNWQDRREQDLAADEATAQKWRFSLYSGNHPLDLKFIRFWSRARLDNWEGRAAWTLRGLSGSPMRKQSPNTWLRSADVLDVSETLGDGGKFTWTPPHPGKWTVIRIGHVFNGMKNSPAPAEAVGMECDKLSPRGIETVFNNYIGRLEAGSLKGKLNGALLDSWECRRQTWTDGMEGEFEKLNGYELRRKLPAVFGWVLDDPKKTAEFLLDWRGTIGRLIEENYYGRMAELCHERGMTCQYETAFGDVIPGDLMRFWKYADEPMCEFWQPHKDCGGVGSHNFKPVRPCVSAARLYGKRRVSAEACTSFELTWNEDFNLLKDTIDKHMGRGISHCVYETYTHNPLADGRLPGTSFGAKIGTPMLRGQTWWKHLRELNLYVARCGFMLESGLPVTDVLYFLGDALDHKPDEHNLLPSGFLCDYLNTDALMTRLDVKDGRWITSEGISWEYVWIPEGTYMRDATAAKIAELKRKGGKVCTDAALTLAKLSPDVDDCGDGDALVWQHRRDQSCDWYFVAAPGKLGHHGKVVFRASGDVSLWDAVSGEVLPALANASSAGKTEVDLELPAGGSIFVVFDHSRQVVVDRPLPSRPDATREFAFSDKWSLKLGCDTAESVLDEFKPWCDLPGTPERKAFSGDGVYRNSFEAPKLAKGERLELDLGGVWSWAKVSINGKTVRTLWCAPYACDITDFIRQGKNDICVEVTSTWYNRLAYDANLPESERKTWTICGPEKGSALKLSGLVGPVKLLVRGRKSPFGSTLVVGAPFGNHMVLQRGVDVPVWGWYKPGAEIVVDFAGNVRKSVVADDGSWRVYLPPMAASRESRVLTVTAGEVVRKYEDVLVGEVWLAGGQSNMEMPIVGANPRYRDGEGAMVTQYADLPFIRYANMPLAGAVVPEKRAAVRWRKFSPNGFGKLPGEMQSISAVAFYYARELHLALGGVPVGVLEACCGGTGIDTWTPRIGLRTRPELRDVLEFPVTEKWTPSMRTDIWYSKQQQPTYFYNAMVAPLAPFAVKGAIWYQGCNNETEPERYCSKMHALYNGWSKAFENPKLSFHFAQLAPYAPLQWWGVQMAQTRFASEQPNASMTVLVDVGNPADIHPNHKETVSRRLLLHALRRDYGMPVKDESPSFKAKRTDGNQLVVCLDHAESLYVYSPDRTLSMGFELAGEDGEYHPAEIVNFKAVKRGTRTEIDGLIDGRELVLRAKGVSSPKSVRYLATKPYIGNVYNEVALPLGPFESK